MKEAARHWLDFARRDLLSARILAEESALSGISVFHSQQCIEKVLKAILENEELSVPKTHDLERLMALVCPVAPDLNLNEEQLSLLSSFYLDSRYPPTLAFPCGEPSLEDARAMLDFADRTYRAVQAILHP
jgi:HEPN domain-containing protein